MNELGTLGCLSRCWCFAEVIDEHERLVVGSDGAQAHHTAPLKDVGLFNELFEVVHVFHTGHRLENCARPGQVHVWRASGCDGRCTERGCTGSGLTTAMVRTSQSRGVAAAIVRERVTFALLTGIAVAVVVVDTLTITLTTLIIAITDFVVGGAVRTLTIIIIIEFGSLRTRAVGVRAVGVRPLSFPSWRCRHRTRSWCCRVHQCRARVGGLFPKPQPKKLSRNQRRFCGLISSERSIRDQ